MKRMFFVSTGRCGTMRAAQILDQYLPKDEYLAIHQPPLARIANIIGTIMLTYGFSERIKEFMYKLILRKYTENKHFICTDPLVSLIIPKSVIASDDTAIIHITRDPKSFAGSFRRRGRQFWKSFIAHYLLPYWQVGIYPLENFFNKNIEKKYEKVQLTKNKYFRENYSDNPHFVEATMEELFDTDFLERQVNEFFGTNIQIDESDLKSLANQTKQ